MKFTQPFVEFPAVVIVRDSTDISPKIKNLDDLRGNGEVILIIDDEENIRVVAAHMLTFLGYKTAVAASGEEAIAYLQDHRADLLLLDMIMDPGINGRETYEKILAGHPGQKALITSGFSKNKEVKRAQGLGAGRYIRKPYSIEKLGAAIQGELLKEPIKII